MRAGLVMLCLVALVLSISAPMVQAIAVKGQLFNMIWTHAAKYQNNPEQVNIPYNDCNESGHVKILNVTANNWPPVKGSNLILNVTGNADEKVTSGTYNLQVTYYGITIINQNGDLSTFIQLPAGPGIVNISYSEDLPSSAPSGPYVVTISTLDQNSQNLLCLQVQFSLSLEGEEGIRPLPLPKPFDPIPTPLSPQLYNKLMHKFHHRRGYGERQSVSTS